MRPSGETAVSVNDRGFQYGDGIFETIRLHHGRPRLFPAHMRRLRAGAAALGIPVPFTEETLHDAMLALARTNGITDGVARLTLSRGNGPRGLVPGSDLRPTLVITAAAGLPYDEPVYEQGLDAVFLPWPRNERSPLVRIKSLSCLENVLGARLARQAGAREGIFLNTAGRVAEGTMSNIFLVKQGAVFTPPVEEGLLPGVIRGFLLAHAPRFTECRLSREDLITADEAFLSNAVLGVAPLVRVDGAPVGDGRPGPCTRRLREWLRCRLIEAETAD